MEGVLEERRAIDVGVDHSTLKGETLGTDTRYSVTLTGPVDGAWAAAYRILQSDSTAFRRLRLDPATRVVSFICRTIDGPAQVFDILERLDALIKMVNRQVLGRR
jgi:hypothetical protein